MQKIANAFFAFIAAFACDGGRLVVRYLLKLAVVNFGHIGKTRPETLVVLSTKRIYTKHIYVVGDQHQTPGTHIGIQAARGVRQDQISYPEHSENTHRKRYL